MVTIFLSILLVLTVLVGYFTSKFSIVEFSNGFRINKKPLFYLVFSILVILFQPFEIEKIDAGSVGLIENKLSGERGISNIKFASGYQFYNKYTQNIHEIPVDISNVDYGNNALIVKGGYACPMHLVFSVRPKAEAADLLYTDLRKTYAKGGLELIYSTWLNTAIMGGINHVSNRFKPDSIFNNQEAFEAANFAEANKRVSKYFIITQMRTNINPPESMKKIITDNAKLVQETQTAELNAVKAIAENKTKVARAQGDLDAAILQAKAKDVLSQPKMLELYNAETMRLWAEKGISPYGNSNVFGTMPTLMLKK